MRTEKLLPSSLKKTKDIKKGIYCLVETKYSIKGLKIMITIYEITTNNFDIIEVSSKYDLVKKYADTFKNNTKFLVWENGTFPIAWMQGIMVKGCLEE